MKPTTSAPDSADRPAAETPAPPAETAASEADGAVKPASRADRFAGPLDTPWKRFDAWTNMVFVDHAFFRYAYLNLHAVGRSAWRSAQPAPHHVARFARMGVKTVVSLRGGRSFGSLPLERRACEAHGLAFEMLTLRSREPPNHATLHEVAALLDRIEYPALFHCKAGADRAGLMSALYLLIRENAPAAEAQKQLSLRYGHVRQGPTGILDAFIDAYAQADAAEQAQTGERLAFMTWVDRDYRRRDVYLAFQAKGWARWLTDRVLARE